MSGTKPIQIAKQERRELMEVNLLQAIAALLYHKEPVLKEDKKTIVPFEDLLPSEQKPYADQAQELIVILDKLNFTVAPKKPELSEGEGIRKLLRIIESFLKTLNKPQQIHSHLVPWDRLARAIWDGKEI